MLTPVAIEFTCKPLHVCKHNWKRSEIWSQSWIYKQPSDSFSNVTSVCGKICIRL